MGACTSTQNTESRKGHGGGGVLKGKIIHEDGRIQEFKQPIRARSITSQNPGCFLCNLECMFIGSCVTQVGEEELLQPDQIYFLMPISRAQAPISLADLCALAIKASSTLAKHSSFTFR